MKEISKELFCMAIRELEKADKYQDDLNSFLKNHACDGHLFQPDCSSAVLMILHEIFEEENQDDIGYFCFELNYGKKYKKGCFQVNKKNVDISTPEKLYDYLVGNVKEEKINEETLPNN